LFCFQLFEFWEREKDSFPAFSPGEKIWILEVKEVSEEMQVWKQKQLEMG